MGAIVYRILLGRHKCEEVVSNFLFLGEPRNDAVPAPAIGVADRVQVELVPLAFNRIESLRCSRNDCRSNLSFDRLLFRILSKGRKITPGRFHDRMPGQE